MKQITLIIALLFVIIPVKLYSQKQNKKQELYYNVKDEKKNLSKIIDECHLQIANNLPDAPYEIYTLGKILLKGEKNSSNGYFHITMEILKIKNEESQDVFQLGAWLYFTKVNQTDKPILINIVYAKTENISLEKLKDTYTDLTKYSKNKISEITKIPVENYTYEEYWGD
ncbi:hypothetical protein [Flavobacterium psychrophilum]|uniref:hypothetical protein n=1 Tax=Flavobacterium psychrophilum TaxID=96345 RepID=UPI00106D2562|nr:hypothetical protein [Flavobacterium psychrophilum]